MKRLVASLVAFAAVCAVGSSLTRAPLRHDYGRLRVVVLQSDDWGLEGWAPDQESAAALPELAESAPAGLESYSRSTLESAADVRAIAGILAEFVDLDGLPPILQANTVVAGVSAEAPTEDASPPAFGFRLRAPGSAGSRYARPGLWEAVRDAESDGLWRAELHGLTHLDLSLLRSAALAGDPWFERARPFDVVHCEGLGRGFELGHADAARELAVVQAAHAGFVRLFGRDPVSVIAADYRWSRQSERAWRELGLQVVQAKAEQRDPSARLGGIPGRIRKRRDAIADRRRGQLLYLDRVAELEPYGDDSLAARQGALRAADAIEGAWGRGEPAIVSIHRLQLVHLDQDFAAAGRAQLRALLAELERRGGARFLVDAELAQLERGGVSVLRRGSNWLVRNLTPGPRPISLPDRALAVVVDPGMHRIVAQSSWESVGGAQEASP